jgi:hypothetical protein
MINITPAPVDGVFFANDGKVDAATFYLNGRRLDSPVADYPDLVGLMAASLQPGTYATCAAYAAIKFGPGGPDGLVTADVVNTNAGYVLHPETTELPRP